MFWYLLQLSDVHNHPSMTSLRESDVVKLSECFHYFAERYSRLLFYVVCLEISHNSYFSFLEDFHLYVSVGTDLKKRLDRASIVVCVIPT